MKTDMGTGLGYFAMAALVVGAVAFSAPPAMAGNAYGKDGNPGKAAGHAENGGPAATNNGNGNMASAMGSLNAAHASANGLAHANAKSKVGMLAAYMDAMVVYEAEYGLVDWAAYDLIIADIATIDGDIAALQADIDALDPEDTDYVTDKQALEDQIGVLEGDKAVLQADADALTAAVDAASTDAAGNLQDAANKDGLIDADVVDAVNSLLDGKSEDFTHSTVIHESEDGIAEIVNPSE
ncbi:MAG: hypothetical protein IMF08_09090 [Proteobacteria bacterium]|nr:hypothetical protein [Pseudomonadota bacterium]